MCAEVIDIVVIGAGPIGGHVASITASAGLSVLVLEEREKVGRPVQCAGLVTPRVFDMVDHARPSILNHIKGAKIFSPSGKVLNIGSQETQAVVIDRAGFDRQILEHAKGNGAEIYLGSKVTGLQRDNRWKIDFTQEGEDRSVRSRLVVGADGWGSKVRKRLGLEEPKYFLNGFGAEVEGLELDSERVSIFIGNDVAPKFFAWAIPAGGRARIGLCIREADEPVHSYFKKLVEKGPLSGLMQNAKTISTHSGRIPLGMLPKTFAKGAMIVGDAASQVKGTSGGGIYTGLVCAGHCASTAVEAIGKDDISEKMLSTYHRAWMKDIGDELKKDVQIHRVIASMSDRQFDEIFDILGQDDILDLINRIGDIDYPSRLAWNLLRKEPRLLKYAGKYLKYSLAGR